MKVGVPREIKTHEYRVGLTPGAVREYVAAGRSVLVETNAGAGIGATDENYRKAGATIVGSAREVFASSEMIVKVKEPQPSEWTQLRENQILFTYLHLAPDPEQTKALIKSGCTAVAYETVTDAHGGLPVLAPMSEVAGRLSIEAAGAALKRYAGGRGLLIGGVPGVQPARIAVIGGGVVGTHAARMAGAEVSILDRSIPRLRELERAIRGAGSCQVLDDRLRRRGGIRGGRRNWRGAPSRCQRAEAGQPRHVELDAQGFRDRRRGYRSGRMLRDLTSNDACRSHLRGRWRHSLQRRQYAGSCPADLKPGAEQRHAAVWLGARQ